MSEQEPAPGSGEDTADLFAAILNIWLALNAIQKTLPEPQAGTVLFAVDGLATVMASLVKRHDIKITTEVIQQEGGHHE